MDIVFTGLTASVTFACIALLGYLAGLRKRQPPHHRPLAGNDADTQTLIAEVESVSDQLRRSMATHHLLLTRCREQIQSLSHQASNEVEANHQQHCQELLGPTQRLSEDIAHAYDELRQHTSALTRLRLKTTVARPPHAIPLLRCRDGAQD